MKKVTLKELGVLPEERETVFHDGYSDVGEGFNEAIDQIGKVKVGLDVDKMAWILFVYDRGHLYSNDEEIKKRWDDCSILQKQYLSEAQALALNAEEIIVKGEEE